MFEVVFIGRLAVNAERKVENGNEVIKLRIADNHVYRNSQGEKVEEVTWASVFYRGKSENLLPYLLKGTPVYVRGRGSLRVYSSAVDRCMKAGLSIMATDIVLLPYDRPLPSEVDLRDESGASFKFVLGYVNAEPNVDADLVLYDANGAAFTTQQKQLLVEKKA